MILYRFPVCRRNGQFFVRGTRAHDYLHDVHDCKGAKEGEDDYDPPASPEKVDESTTAEVKLLVYEAYSDVDQSRGTHRVAADIQALNRMANHDAPDIRKYRVSGKRHDVENQEKRKVEEEEYIREYLERHGIRQVWIVVKEDRDGSCTHDYCKPRWSKMSAPR